MFDTQQQQCHGITTIAPVRVVYLPVGIRQRFPKRKAFFPHTRGVALPESLGSTLQATAGWEVEMASKSARCVMKAGEKLRWRGCRSFPGGN